MNTRWIIPSIALAGFALLAWWIAENSDWVEIDVPTPLRGEAATNPFYTAQHFTEALGAQTEWRHILGTAPAKDSILVLKHWHWSLIASRRLQLEHWVESGGRLVLDHTLIGGEEELKHWSGLERVNRKHAEDEGDEESKPSVDEKNAASKDKKKQPGKSICGHLHASYHPAAHDLQDSYYVCGQVADSWISSTRPVFWALHDADGMQAARIEIGQGSVTLLNANPFGNRDLMDADHDLLFVAVTQLQRGDHVVFLSEENHPTVLALLWDNGKPVVLLVALLILTALWRGAVRFGPLATPTETARRSLAEQIRGTGLFTLHFDGSQTLHAAMLRAVDEAARRRIVNYANLPSGERVAALARAANLDPGKLAETLHHRGTRSTYDLQHAVALLETLRRALLEHSAP